MQNNHAGEYDAIVVGAGQAGLAVSYHLKQRGLAHLLLDRGRPGEIWRSQRWDSFVLNTPNLANSLPGKPFYPERPMGFESPEALVSYFDEYVNEMQLPFQGETNVVSAARSEDGRSIVITTDRGAYQTANLVAASGGQNVPKVPSIAAQVPEQFKSIHASDYRNPQQLPPGAVLVIGSGQSGVQIAQDLMSAQRTVYLSTSKVGRLRRKFRGRDVVEWLLQTGMMNQAPDELENLEEQYATQPVATGVDGGKTISIQSLWRTGVNLLGRIESFDGSTALFQDNLRDNIEFGDAFSARILGRLNEFINKVEPTAPQIEDDPADDVDFDALALHAPTRLDLDAAGITSIIWTTGFAGDYSWIELEGHRMERDRPVQTNGASPAKGLYFIGTPWLRTRGSGIIYGVDADAAAIVDAIAG